MASYKKSITDKKDTAPKIKCQNKDCAKMGRYQSENNFYKSHNPEMPHHPFCKQCVDEMVDINNLETLYNILRALDTPFILDVWAESFAKCENNDSKNYLGEYLNLINNTYRGIYGDKRWIDSKFESVGGNEIPETVQGQIDEIPKWNDEWYGEYTASDLKYLNDYYEALKKDFKIVTRNHQDYARKIAQASLAMNKAYNEMSKNKIKENMDAYKMASANFDTLSKSAQFSESSRSANDVSLGSFGVLFDRVEKHEWIPEYIPEKEDVYDKLIKQFSNIDKSL